MGVDGDVTITTGVDSLLNLLKKKKKLSLEEVSKELGIKQEVLQTWVDFLVEEKIVGIEYKFTKPYVYLNEVADKEDSAKNLAEAKEIYHEELKQKGVSEEEIEYYWKDKILSEIKTHKEEFFKLAKQKKIENVGFLWEKFVNKIIK